MLIILVPSPSFLPTPVSGLSLTLSDSLIQILPWLNLGTWRYEISLYNRGLEHSFPYHTSNSSFFVCLTAHNVLRLFGQESHISNQFTGLLLSNIDSEFQSFYHTKAYLRVHGHHGFSSIHICTHRWCPPHLSSPVEHVDVSIFKR